MFVATHWDCWPIHNQALKRKWILGDQPDVEGKSPKAHAATNQELVNWKMLFSLLNTFFPLSSWQSLWHTLGALVWKFTYCHSGDNPWSLSPHATSFKFSRGGTIFFLNWSHICSSIVTFRCLETLPWVRSLRLTWELDWNDEVVGEQFSSIARFKWTLTISRFDVDHLTQALKPIDQPQFEQLGQSRPTAGKA